MNIAAYSYRLTNIIIMLDCLDILIYGLHTIYVRIRPRDNW